MALATFTLMAALFVVTLKFVLELASDVRKAAVELYADFPDEFDAYMRKPRSQRYWRRYNRLPPELADHPLNPRG